MKLPGALESDILTYLAVDDKSEVLLFSSCPHIKPQPGKPGPIIWVSGPPGAGKSTTCQLLARTQDYIYYEADCTGNLINPFTDVNIDNPSIASFASKPLKVKKYILTVELSKKMYPT